MLLTRLYGVESARDNSDMADAMRYLLDQSAPLHMNLFQAKLTGIDATEAQQTISEEMSDTFSEEELQWRKSLKVGSYLDCVKHDYDRNIKVWGKAQVVSLIDGLLEVSFLHDESKMNRTRYWHSQDIAAFDTHSTQEDWRAGIKEGDNVDALDNSKLWYSSTIIKVEWRNDPSQPTRA